MPKTSVKYGVEVVSLTLERYTTGTWVRDREECCGHGVA